MQTCRTFLFLQGPLSPLFSRIGDRLAAAGHIVLRVNLCIGDRMHWHRPGAIDYRGRPGDWRAFVDDLMAREGVSDLIVHGDRRFYHREAGEAARARRIRVIASELGYLRPDWMTIERDATSTGSHFPDDPATIRAIAAAVGPLDLSPRFRSRFWLVAMPDVGYNLANTALRFLYPHYRRHTPDYPLAEYISAGARLLGQGRRDAAARALAQDLHARGEAWFVLPMQLDGDFQLRDHSPFGGMEPALRRVLASFAAHAPPTTRLVVKAHPLDNGLRRWPRVVASLAREMAIGERVDYADGGRLDDLCANARAMVTVNSAAGLEALRAGLPVKCLAPAIYDVAGMCDAASLEDFWSAPMLPDPTLVNAFVTALAGSVQARGTIHDRGGLEEAVATMSARILENRLNEPKAFVDPPPRLERARAIGAPL